MLTNIPCDDELHEDLDAAHHELLRREANALFELVLSLAIIAGIAAWKLWRARSRDREACAAAHARRVMRGLAPAAPIGPTADGE